MNTIEIYTTNHCVFCDRAKELFKSKNLSFTEYNIFSDPQLLGEMLKKTNGKKTMPQIFINNLHIGGFDELKNLVNIGEFEKIINS